MVYIYIYIHIVIIVQTDAAIEQKQAVWRCLTCPDIALADKIFNHEIHMSKDRAEYTRSPSQDFRLFGPRPWKILATYEQMGS